jgi:hypothetical protein
MSRNKLALQKSPLLISTATLWWYYLVLVGSSVFGTASFGIAPMGVGDQSHRKFL